MKVYQDCSWMFEHYIARKESTPVMARKAGCSYGVIYYWLRKMGIPVRSRGEGIFLATRNFLTFSPELLELLKGELLGDGCISMASNRSARYQHSSKYRAYLVWLSRQFAASGLVQSGKIHKYRAKRGTIFLYRTRSYPELVLIRQRWYPKGKKIVPKDLKLTPIMARQWYTGDGCLVHRKHRRPHIKFATNGFDVDSVEYLVGELREQGFRVTHWPANNVIGLSADSVKDFLSWIGPSPVACYQYKWNY